MQPRRAQILDLIGWYERQLTKVGVDIRLNSYIEASDVDAIGADAVILATGSYSPETGFQKALPSIETPPGMDQGNVFGIEAVMARQARPADAFSCWTRAAAGAAAEPPGSSPNEKFKSLSTSLKPLREPSLASACLYILRKASTDCVAKSRLGDNIVTRQLLHGCGTIR